MAEQQELLEQLKKLFSEPKIRQRAFYPEFRRKWLELLEKTAGGSEYFPCDAADVFSLPCSCFGIDFTLHFSRSKMNDWFRQELQRGKTVVFTPKRLRRDRSGRLFFKDAPCLYTPGLPEADLDESQRNIFACAVPGDVPHLQVVYGNRWVNERFSILRQRTLSLFWIQTDYVPAFLADAFEICVYLFLMDCSILIEDAEKVEDEKLQPLLHIFRPSPMLVIKRLIHM